MKKILVIEDEPQMRANIVTIIEMEGHRALQAENGRKGLAVAQAEHPSLVICDLMMPDMNGHEVLTALRADPVTRNMPFIFLTARGEKSDLRKGMNLGADDYLTKPISVDDLVAAINVRLKRQQDQRNDAAPQFISSEPLQKLGLTPREADVLFWVAQGKTNIEAGEILGTTTGTVKKHLEHIFEKLGLENRSSAALRAVEFLQTGR